MDQAKQHFRIKAFYGTTEKYSQNSDLDRHLVLCSCGHREETLESGPKSLQNSTAFECDPF